MIRFVTFSTPGKYRKAAARMIASAEKVGVEIVHYERPEFKSWRLALYEKPRVIREAMGRFPGDDICWIDADAEFRAYPTGLFSIPDGKHVASYTEHTPEGEVLWGATLWFRRGDEALGILDLWEEENRIHNDCIDDNNLMHAVMGSGKGGLLERLPPSYFFNRSMKRRFPGCRPIILQHCIGPGRAGAKFRPWKD